MATVEVRKTGVLMTACTQPGCTGTIVDGYCDVCGSPADAVPFVPVKPAASAASPALADEPAPTAASHGSGCPSESTNEGLNTACTQPGCTGTIVDGYCDVCGSPADRVPFVPAEAAASPGSPAPADEAGLTAVPVPASVPAPLDEELPTQRVSRVKMPSQHLPTPETAVRGATDRGDVDAEKVHGEKEHAKHEPDGAQGYRTRVEEAQLPDDVREAALCEVGKLERTSDQSRESGDIRTWLETILDLPWSTKTTDWIDIQGSREVETTLRRLIDPAAAGLEEGDAAEVAAAAGLEEGDAAEVAAAAGLEEGDAAEVAAAAGLEEKADTTPAAGPQHDDTVKMPAVPAVLSRGRHESPQDPEQPVLGPEPVQTPAKKRRFGYLALAATALAALLIGALLFAASRDRGVTAQSVPTVTATATATATKPTSEPAIQLENLAASARPFQTVRIEGTYRSGPDTFLQVQRWEGGKWLSFPLPAKTDNSGQFTAFVELGQPGRYRLRVVDTHSGVASKTFVLAITG
jgi:hypothetical protein